MTRDPHPHPCARPTRTARPAQHRAAVRGTADVGTRRRGATWRRLHRPHHGRARFPRSSSPSPAPTTTRSARKESTTSQPSSRSPDDGSTCCSPCSATAPSTRPQPPHQLDQDHRGTLFRRFGGVLVSPADGGVDADVPGDQTFRVRLGLEPGEDPAQVPSRCQRRNRSQTRSHGP